MFVKMPLAGTPVNNMNYKRVYFRINTPSYRTANGIGFQDQDGKKFDDEAVNIFVNDGWDIKKRRYNGRCSTVTKDKQELYLHPDNFSGVVIEENISHIEQVIKDGNLFTLRWTDIYDDVFDMTDEEYLKLLQSKKAEIKLDLLEKFQTKRSNLYITSVWNGIDSVYNKHHLKRLSSYVGVYSSSDIDWQFIEGVFNELVSEEKIVTAETKKGTGYRTNKKLLAQKTTV